MPDWLGTGLVTFCGSKSQRPPVPPPAPELPEEVPKLVEVAEFCVFHIVWARVVNGFDWVELVLAEPLRVPDEAGNTSCNTWSTSAG